MQPIEAECVKMEHATVLPLDTWLVFELHDGDWWYEECDSEAKARDMIAAMRLDGVDAEVRVCHCTDQPREPKPLPTREEVLQRWTATLAIPVDFVLSEIKRWRDQ